MRLSLVLLALPSVALAAPAVANDPRSLASLLTSYLPPSLDPFYKPPPTFSRSARGTVLAARDVHTAYDGVASRTRQVLYRTTGARGEADATVATLFRPLVPAMPPRIMLLMPPTDSACVDCQTSYALVNHRNPLDISLTTATALNAATNGLDILAGLSKGWFVALPDHEGSKAAFISGVTEAFAGLDGLRALLNEGEVLRPEERDGYKAVIHGYSGGGHGSAWATQFLSTYGAGLNVIAAAYGGVPVDLFATLKGLNKSLFASLAFSALAGMANAYPELDAWISANVNACGRTKFAQARSDCNSFISAPGADVYSYLTKGAAALDEPLPQKYFALGLLGQPITARQTGGAAGTDGRIGIPTFQYHSASDEIVAYGPVPGYVADQCARGARITFATTALSGHITALIAFLGDAYIFMDNAFEGRFGPEGCSTQNSIVAPLFSPAYVQAIGEQAWKQVRGLNGRNVGGETVRLPGA
ncbi:hypothetical protein JCM10450v2_008165 [Rhodotorula kratochvilovae]